MTTTIQLFQLLDSFYSTHKFTIKNKERIYSCFFHKDSTPSLHINKDTYHCFGCNAKGNALTLLKHYYNNDDSKAVYIQYLKDTNQFDDNYTNKSKVELVQNIDNLPLIQQILASCNELTAPTEYMQARGITNIKCKNIYILKKNFDYSNDNKKNTIFKDTVIIPIYIDGAIASLQLLIQQSHSNKFFLPNHPIKNGYCEFVVNSKSDEFVACEGVYDALCINMAGYNAIATFSAGNLLSCSKHYIEQWFTRVHIYADNDTVGKKSGLQASKYLQTKCIFPNYENIKDANDLILNKGVKELKNDIYYSTISSYEARVERLFEQGVIKVYESEKLRYYAKVFNEDYQDMSKANLGIVVSGLMSRNNMILTHGVKGEITERGIGRLCQKHAIRFKATNYHPAYKYFELYKEKNTEDVYLNIYKPSGLHALPQKRKTTIENFPTIYSHIVHLCSGNQEYANWFMQFLANKWQNPSNKDSFMPIFYGSQGSGKGLLKELVCCLFGANVNSTLSTRSFTSSFNKGFKDILFGFVDESVSDKNAYETIKQLTGDKKYTLNNKNQEEIANYNFFGNIILLSNNDYTYKVTKDDRRAVLFEQDKLLSKEHYNTMTNILVNGVDKNNELSSFACYLANLDTTEQLIHLKTKERINAMELSKSTEEEFVDLLSEDFNSVIKDINTMHNKSFPTIEDEETNIKNGYFIQVDNEKGIIHMCSTMFCNLYNLKYKENSRINRQTYSNARKNKAFTYNSGARIGLQGVQHRYVSIALKDFE